MVLPAGLEWILDGVVTVFILAFWVLLEGLKVSDCPICGTHGVPCDCGDPDMDSDPDEG